MTDTNRINELVQELLDLFNVTNPPVPVETMLRRPPNDLWEDVDPTQLSGTFLSLTDRYSPRMSLARLFVRPLMESPWGKERKLNELLITPDSIATFARILVMPEQLMESTAGRGRTPTTVSIQFEVPEDEAEKRMLELID